MSAEGLSVAIVIVNWNGWRDTIDCLRSCLGLHGVRFNLIVCDNASSDGSVEQIHAWALGADAPSDPNSPLILDPDARPKSVAVLDHADAASSIGGTAQLVIIRCGGNLGFAGGNNVGLRYALRRGFDFVWLLNNDTVVPSNALKRLVAVAVADSAIGLCGSTLVEYFQPDTIQAMAAALNLRNFQGRHVGFRKPLAQLAETNSDEVRRHEISYPVGASILISREFLIKIGLMEESYFLYYEEADWVLRARGRYRVAFAKDSIVYHKGGASAGSTPQGTSSRSVGFLYRSRLRVARQFAPASLPAVILTILYEAVRGLARGRTGRARAAFLALTGQVKVPH